MREQHDLVEQQAGALKDALDARTTLFANISHEFRTPLTLIAAAFDKLERRPDPEAIELGRRYVNRLLRLVEQLLDLSRLKLRQNVQPARPWRLDTLVAQTVQAFTSVASHSNIELHAEIDGQWQTQCPGDLVEKILLNLLTNAIKYTPPGGDVQVALHDHADGAELTVRDTGPGIPESEQAVIFDRFYRTESAETHHSGGAGIGLALVKEAVAALGGTIRLDSAPGQGSAFSVRLPARRARDDSTENPQTSSGPDTRRRQIDVQMLAGLARPEAGKLEATRTATEPANAPSNRNTILIVEDNDDLRDWIASTLSEQWRVYQAPDGRAGLQQARKHAPDIIISDLMMPVLDGFGLLRALREDIETSHIPVLMLTARQDDQTGLRPSPQRRRVSGQTVQYRRTQGPARPDHRQPSAAARPPAPAAGPESDRISPPGHRPRRNRNTPPAYRACRNRSRKTR